jgi:hypothetical protein
MKNCLDCATALTDTATSCWACGLESHDVGHKADTMFVEVSASKGEQHELTQRSIKRVTLLKTFCYTLLKTFCYTSLVVLPIAGYFSHLKQAGKETPIPAVANGVEEFKQQQQPVATDQPEELPVFPSQQERPSKSDWTPDPNSPLPGFGDAGTRDDSSFSFSPNIVEGRTIHLMLVFTDVGIRNSSLPPNVDRKTAVGQYEFLKRLIYEKLGKPPLRGSEEEWDRYIDKIYAFDIDEYLA